MPSLCHLSDVSRLSSVICHVSHGCCPLSVVLCHFVAPLSSYRSLISPNFAPISPHSPSFLRTSLLNATYDAPNPAFDLEEGFAGFVNAETINGAPVYYSQPRLLLVDESWRHKVHGIKEPTNDECGSFVWLEPITGLALKSAVRLQVNMYLPADREENGGLFRLYYPDVVKDVMFPVAWTEQYGVVTPELANDLQTELIDYLEILDSVFIIGTTVGAVVAVGAFALSIAVWKRGARRDDYLSIQDH